MVVYNSLVFLLLSSLDVELQPLNQFNVSALSIINRYICSINGAGYIATFSCPCDAIFDGSKIDITGILLSRDIDWLRESNHSIRNSCIVLFHVYSVNGTPTVPLLLRDNSREGNR
jgi:hypothetical protein